MLLTAKDNLKPEQASGVLLAEAKLSEAKTEIEKTEAYKELSSAWYKINHFAIAGTGGGPVTILNNKFLANSDFFTGAFPAEYGNSIAGAFDLKMRNGNNEKHEFSGQLGFLGTEIMAEGPLSKKSRSSYLVTYRYSTLQLFNFLGIDVGTDAVPQYQDASFRLNFPFKNNANLSIFGMGGISGIDIVLSNQMAPDTSTLIYGSNDRDQYFKSSMGFVGATYTQPINKSTFLKAGISASKQNIDVLHNQIYRYIEDDLFILDSIPTILDYNFNEDKYSAYVFVNKKLSPKSSLKFGVNSDLFHFTYVDSAKTVLGNLDSTSTIGNWQVRWDANEYATLLQPYIQWKYSFNDKLTLNAGITSLYYSINTNSFSPIEPRLGLSYAIRPGEKLSLGLGHHSQIQPNYLYFYGKESINGDPQEHNKDLGLTKSNHIVLSYSRGLGKSLRLKAETYYQELNDIPVEVKSSAFSFVNTGAGFTRFFPDTLANTGTGQNYGVELTLEKFFSGGYYFLITGSVFDSKYKGSDGISRNTSFNGRYAFNGLFAKEFTFKNQTALNVGGKITTTGGRWYGPVDTLASAQALEIIYQDANTNSLQFRPYFRADLKINYRWNRPKVTHEFAIDFVNIFDTQNILTLTYAPDNPLGPIREEYQLGFLPIFYYKLDF